MTISSTPNTPAKWPQAIVNTIWPLLTGRRRLLLLSGAVVGVGLIFNWDWFVAIGIAPMLIAVLPCLVMCGLGMCMSGAGRASCGNDESDEDPDNRRGSS